MTSHEPNCLSRRQPSSGDCTCIFGHPPPGLDQRLLFPVLLNSGDTATIRELLAQVPPYRGVDAELSAAAAYWADGMAEPLEPMDVETVAWLLRDLQRQPALPAPTRDRCRYWATCLEGRLV